MFREGTNPADVQMSDVLCDFCQRPWALEIGMIEGHQGHVICGRCVTVAYAAVGRAEEDAQGAQCYMCLENRENDPGWVSPLRDEAVICRRCVRMAATALEHDDEVQWKRPGT